MDLGVNGWQTFRYVVLPNLSSALLAGGMPAFALSLMKSSLRLLRQVMNERYRCGCSISLGDRYVPVTNVVALLVMSGNNLADPGAWWLTR